MADFLRSPPPRVAVASQDGRFIDECFGRARQYRIYQAGPRGYQLAGIRTSPIPCREQHHDERLLAQAIELLADCGLVLAGRIGPQALRQLQARGMAGLTVHLEINEALRRLYRWGEAKQQGNKK